MPDSVGQRDKFVIIVRRQLKAAMRPVALPPGLFRRLDPFPGRGDEVPPDVARTGEGLAAISALALPTTPISLSAPLLHFLINVLRPCLFIHSIFV
jgi:hypothetical protein